MTPSAVVRDLVIYLDSGVSMRSQVVPTVSQAAVQYSSFAVSLGLPISRCFVAADEELHFVSATLDSTSASGG